MRTKIILFSLIGAHLFAVPQYVVHYKPNAVQQRLYKRGFNQDNRKHNGLVSVTMTASRNKKIESNESDGSYRQQISQQEESYSFSGDSRHVFAFMRNKAHDPANEDKTFHVYISGDITEDEAYELIDVAFNPHNIAVYEEEDAIEPQDQGVSSYSSSQSYVQYYSHNNEQDGLHDRKHRRSSAQIKERDDVNDNMHHKVQRIFSWF